MARPKISDVPICHPEREYCARGLCKPCYEKKHREQNGFARRMRERGLPNECGHLDRPHFGKGRCQECYKRWYHNLDSVKEKRKIYQDKNKDRYAASCRQTHMKKKYGLGIDSYESMLSSQNGLCAICGNLETAIINGKIKNLCIDHDHVTGKIRGLLCQNCNQMIGHGQDNSEILEAGAAYLKASYIVAGV